MTSKFKKSEVDLFSMNDGVLKIFCIVIKSNFFKKEILTMLSYDKNIFGNFSIHDLVKMHYESSLEIENLLF